MSTDKHKKTLKKKGLECTPYPGIGISPWETYIIYSTNPIMVGSIDNAGGFKPYWCNLYQFINLPDLVDGI